MKNYRLWGKPPYTVAVVHGGPGAAGEMAAVADELSKTAGVLEPLQTAKSVAGQVEELRETLQQHAAVPVTLVGHSWGAWLVFIMAARYPGLAKKLILVGSGSFTAEAADGIGAARLDRLSETDRIEFLQVADILNGPAAKEKDKAFARLGALAAKADTYHALPLSPYPPPRDLGPGEAIYREVMPEAAALRDSGKLLAMGKQIGCPVLAIGGDYDTHLVEGVNIPLSRVLENFKFVLLEKCGHEPWLEKYARDEFFRIIRKEIGK